MTQHVTQKRASAPELSQILAADEVQPNLLRQITNGVGAALLLLITGLVVLLVVLWKAP